MLSWIGPTPAIGEVDLCGAVVRLAHQLISGSSMTACHNPACTAQTIEEDGFTLFAGARDANRILDYPSPPPLDPYPGIQSPEKRVESRPRRIAFRLWPRLLPRERGRSRRSARERLPACGPRRSA